MPAPSSPVLDDFNTGAGQALTSRAGWGATEFWIGETTLFTDAVPTHAGPAPAPWRSNYWVGAMADQEVWVTFDNMGGTTDLYARGAPGATPNAYALEIIPSASTWNIRTYTGGVGSGVLATGTQAMANGDSLGMTVVGWTVEVWYKPAAGAWTMLGSWVDAGQLFPSGVIAFDMNAGGQTIDQFGGGPIIAPQRRVASWITRSGG